jgi:rubrerythrin
MDARDHLDRGNYWTAARILERRKRPDDALGIGPSRTISPMRVVTARIVIEPHACEVCGTTHCQQVCPWCQR